MRIGDKVILTRDVERFPHFVIDAGETGVVDNIAFDGTVWVKLDTHHDSIDPEWDNSIAWPSMTEAIDDLALDNA